MECKKLKPSGSLKRVKSSNFVGMSEHRINVAVPFKPSTKNSTIQFLRKTNFKVSSTSAFSPWKNKKTKIETLYFRITFVDRKLKVSITSEKN